MAQPLMWLMLITIAIGSYLMNGYLVVKEHPVTIHPNGKRARSYPWLLTRFLTQRAKVKPLSENYSIIFFRAANALSMVYLTATLLHPSKSAISWYVRLPK